MKKKIMYGHSTYDGAGVKLTRIFANDEAELTDPFLLLDHFGSDNPQDYIKGFPWHPHRGIETVTYIFDGIVDHEDSIGNSGSIGAGDIQWMTAGSGIIHQEMPRQSLGMMHGVQLWINLPANRKMMNPRYRGIQNKQIPIITVDGGEVRVIAGEFAKVTGPVHDLIIDVQYLDINLQKGSVLTHESKEGYTSFCYCIDGSGEFDKSQISGRQLVLFKQSGIIEVKAMENMRYLYITGQSLNEPIAWGGPIVMNTQQELELAFREIEEGTFIKK